MRLALFFFLLGSVVTLIAGGDRTRMNQIREGVVNVVTSGLDVVNERIDAYRTGGAEAATISDVPELTQTAASAPIVQESTRQGKPTPIARESAHPGKPTTVGRGVPVRREVYVAAPLNVSQMK